MAKEISWRRHWKPDLRSQPWTILSCDGIDKEFLIKFLFNESGYEILISNKMSLWYENLEGEEIKKRSEKFNPSVEAPLSKILDHLKESVVATDVSTSAKFKAIPENDEQRIILTMSTKLAGLSFIWKFNVMPADRKMFSEHLLVPLVTMAGELSRQQQELVRLLHNKDKEIDDLKAQGVKVTRKHLDTGTFDEVVFKNSMITEKGFVNQVESEGDLAFSPKAQELYRELMTKRAFLDNADTEDMEYAETFEDDSLEPVAHGTNGASWSDRLPPSMAANSPSPTKSPTKSPRKSPIKAGSADDTSPAKDTELLRRQALDRKLAEDNLKHEQKKKKKKIKF